MNLNIYIRCLAGCCLDQNLSKFLDFSDNNVKFFTVFKCIVELVCIFWVHIFCVKRPILIFTCAWNCVKFASSHQIILFYFKIPFVNSLRCRDFAFLVYFLCYFVGSILILCLLCFKLACFNFHFYKVDKFVTTLGIV